jgi:ubiquitin-protein ligase
MTSTAPTTTIRRLMKEYQNEQQQQRQVSSSSSSFRKQAARDENIMSLLPKQEESLDLLEWSAIIKGPVGGFYEGEKGPRFSMARYRCGLILSPFIPESLLGPGGVFTLEITVPHQYPIKPPAIRFKSIIWHPNISWKVSECVGGDIRGTSTHDTDLLHSKSDWRNLSRRAQLAVVASLEPFVSMHGSHCTARFSRAR